MSDYEKCAYRHTDRYTGSIESLEMDTVRRRLRDLKLMI